MTKDKGEISVEGRGRDVHHESDDVQRPLLPVLDGFPELGKVDGLSCMVLVNEHSWYLQSDVPVVHITLARIIAKKSVHHDVLLTFIEPAILAAEPTLGLAGTGGH